MKSFIALAGDNTARTLPVRWRWYARIICLLSGWEFEGERYMVSRVVVDSGKPGGLGTENYRG